MSDSQPQQVTQQSMQDDPNKNVQPKYTVKLYGKYVPIWLVVLVIAVLAWAAWYMWLEHQKHVIGLTSSTRANLDHLAASSNSGNSSKYNASAGIPLSTPNTDDVREQLNKLFNSF